MALQERCCCCCCFCCCFFRLLLSGLPSLLLAFKTCLNGAVAVYIYYALFSAFFFPHIVYRLDLTIKLGWFDLFSMLSLLFLLCYCCFSFILFRCVKHVNQLYCVARSCSCCSRIPLFLYLSSFCARSVF